jgi:excisionase family DNA binding protein
MARTSPPQSVASNEIMTVETLARYLCCHQSTIYRMLKRKEIPAFKIGSDWRFSRTAIEQWMRKATIPADLSGPALNVTKTPI